MYSGRFLLIEHGVVILWSLVVMLVAELFAELTAVVSVAAEIQRVLEM